jgi:hypothetical protein
MSPIPFAPGTAARLDGGGCTIYVHGHGRITLRLERSDHRTLCAVTGERIPKGEPVLVPEPQAAAPFGPFCVSTTGWDALADPPPRWVPGRLSLPAPRTMKGAHDDARRRARRTRTP